MREIKRERIQNKINSNSVNCANCHSMKVSRAEEKIVANCRRQIIEKTCGWRVDIYANPAPKIWNHAKICEHFNSMAD